MTPYLVVGAVNLMAIGMALIVALRIAYGGRVPIADPIYALVRAVGIVLFAFGWLAIVLSIGLVTAVAPRMALGLLLVPSWRLGVLLSVVLLIASLVIAGMIWRQHRVLRQRAHMALLALAVEKQIPLPDCVDAFATEQGGAFAQRAGEFSAALRAGVPLPEAIANNRSVLPRLAEFATQIGQACDRLAPALRDEMVSHSELEPIRRELASRMLYFVLVFAFVPYVVTFLFIKILPEYIKIVSDFEITLPSITIFVIGVANASPLRLLAVAGLLLGLGIMFCAALWYVGVPLPELPGTRWLLKRFDRATIQRALAFPAEQQRPIGPMIDMLAEHHPSWSVRDRLNRAAEQIENGQDWIASLRSQSLLGKADAAVLSAAQRVGNLPWALREMAESNERRLIYRLQALVQIGSVAMVLLLALIVSVVVVAFFTPLIELIMSLA